MRIRLLIRILTVALIPLPSMLGCSGNQNNEDCIVLETETFKLTLGKDAVAWSLVVKGTNEEMLIKGANVPLFSATQDRPFNNETKLQHPNTRTTYKADSLVWDGERLTVGFETAPYKAVVKVENGAGYLRFILEDFICDPEDYGNQAMDLPPVAEFRILQLPVKERRHYGEWLNCMWDDVSAVCVAACDPWSLSWHADRDGGQHRITPRLPDIEGVCHVIDDPDDLTDHGRDRQTGDRACNRRIFEQKFSFIFSHTAHLLSLEQHRKKPLLCFSAIIVTWNLDFQ